MRLIDADALMDDIAVLLERNHKLIDEWLANCIDDVIEQAPTVDAVDVVRCKDCRYYNTTNCCDGCGWCERSGMDRGSWDNWFCADADRKTEPLICDSNCWMKKQNGEWLCEYCQRKPKDDPQTERSE